MADGGLQPPILLHEDDVTRHRPSELGSALILYNLISYSHVVQGHKVASAQALKSSNQRDAKSSLVCDNSIQLKPTTFYQGKPSVMFKRLDKVRLIENLQYTLIGKFSHGWPKIDIIKDFFSCLKLKGNYNVSTFDPKHIIIECGLFGDYVRIWLKLVWFVGGLPMRIFKWTEHFHPLKESAIVPIWIHLPGLPLYLYEEEALMSIVNAIGRPLKIDRQNLNRSKLGYASICVELDVSKAIMDAVWIKFVDEENVETGDGFWQKIVFNYVPPYCQGCAHLGHTLDHCKRRKVDNVEKNRLGDENGKCSDLGAGKVYEESCKLVSEEGCSVMENDYRNARVVRSGMQVDRAGAVTQKVVLSSDHGLQTRGLQISAEIQHAKNDLIKGSRLEGDKVQNEVITHAAEVQIESGEQGKQVVQKEHDLVSFQNKSVTSILVNQDTSNVLDMVKKTMSKLGEEERGRQVQKMGECSEIGLHYVDQIHRLQDGDQRDASQTVLPGRYKASMELNVTESTADHTEHYGRLQGKVAGSWEGAICLGSSDGIVKDGQLQVLQSVADLLHQDGLRQAVKCNKNKQPAEGNFRAILYEDTRVDINKIDGEHLEMLKVELEIEQDRVAITRTDQKDNVVVTDAQNVSKMHLEADFADSTQSRNAPELGLILGTPSCSEIQTYGKGKAEGQCLKSEGSVLKDLKAQFMASSATIQAALDNKRKKVNGTGLCSDVDDEEEALYTGSVLARKVKAAGFHSPIPETKKLTSPSDIKSTPSPARKLRCKDEVLLETPTSPKEKPQESHQWSTPKGPRRNKTKKGKE